MRTSTARPLTAPCDVSVGATASEPYRGTIGARMCECITPPRWCRHDSASTITNTNTRRFALPGALSSAVFIGMLFGGLIAGFAGDAWGRRPLIPLLTSAAVAAVLPCLLRVGTSARTLLPATV